MSAGISLSQVQGWDTGYLTAAAERWSTTARLWEDGFTGLSTELADGSGAGWDGATAEAAQRRAYTDRMAVIGLADRLHSAAAIARDGARRIGDAQRAVLRVVWAAHQSGFTVQQDFSVTGPPVRGGMHRAGAEFFAAELRTAVGALQGADTAVAGRIAEATGALGLPVFPESAGGFGGDPVPSAPPPGAGIEAVDRANRRLLDEIEQHYRALPDGAVRSDRLADVAGIRDALTVPGAHLVFLDPPEDPAGMLGAAISVGDPTTADHCSMTVGGVGATTRGAIAALTRDAAELRAEASRIAAATGMRDTTATMVYLGSDPPVSPGAPVSLTGVRGFGALLGTLGVGEDQVLVLGPPAGASERSHRFDQAAALLGRPELAAG